MCLRAICVAVRRGLITFSSLTLRTDCAIARSPTSRWSSRTWFLQVILGAWCRLPAARQFLLCTRLSFSIGRREVPGRDRTDRLAARGKQDDLKTPDRHCSAATGGPRWLKGRRKNLRRLKRKKL